MKIKDLMTRSPEVAQEMATVASVVDTLWRRDCGIVPVVDAQGKLAGVVTDRDICIALGTRNRLASELHVGEVMTRSPASCGPEDGAAKVLDRMRHLKVRRMPVVDGEGKVVGIFSLGDAIRCAGAARTSDRGLADADVLAALKSVCEQRLPVPAAVARR